MPDPVPNLNPTPAPPAASFWSVLSALAGKRTIILSAVLGVVKLLLPLVPAGSAADVILSFVDNLIPVIIPVTLHAAIVNNGGTPPAKPV